jgi:hypothetical protein
VVDVKRYTKHMENGTPKELPLMYIGYQNVSFC